MSDQLRLTDHDVEAGAAAIRGLVLMAGGHRASEESLVRKIVMAINENRGGDPLGTVRRCPTGAVAVRVRTDDGVYCWRVVHPSGETGESDGDLTNWPVVSRVS